MRVAFIGTGGIARAHAQGLAKREGVTFVGACDVLEDRAQDFAAQFGGTAYATAEEMLDEAKPDVAWVCIPPFAHGEAEMALLERRIPFLVEKPISTCMDTARRILDAVERAGTLAVAGYMSRYRRGVNRARELLADDPAVLLHGGWIQGAEELPWWRVKAQSGGQILEQTTHLFDLARYIVGEPEVVWARATRGFVRDMPGYDVEDASTVIVQFAGGTLGNLMTCCASRAAVGVHLTIVAMHHYVTFTGWDHAAIIRKSEIEEEHIAGEPNIFEIEDGAFIEAVASGNAGLIRSPYSDALKTLAFCLAANKSIETGEPVRVDSI